MGSENEEFINNFRESKIRAEYLKQISKDFETKYLQFKLKDTEKEASLYEADFYVYEGEKPSGITIDEIIIPDFEIGVSYNEVAGVIRPIFQNDLAKEPISITFFERLQGSTRAIKHFRSKNPTDEFRTDYEFYPLSCDNNQQMGIIKKRYYHLFKEDAPLAETWTIKRVDAMGSGNGRREKTGAAASMSYVRSSRENIMSQNK